MAVVEHHDLGRVQSAKWPLLFRCGTQAPKEEDDDHDDYFEPLKKMVRLCLCVCVYMHYGHRREYNIPECGNDEPVAAVILEQEESLSLRFVRSR